MIKLNAKKLRKSKPAKTQIAKIKRRGIYIICDNILDTYNIGSIFRLADAVSAKKIYLCGATETPPNSRISKASVGTDKWVPWEYASTVVEAVSSIKYKVSSIKVIAIEQSKKSVDYRKVNYQLPETNNQPSSRAQAEGALVFVVGHETSGVSKEALKMCDQIVEIPMFGINKSLNVMVSLAVVLYKNAQ